MAIPKKRSRRLVVDGQSYRWIVSIRNNTVNVVVEIADNPGQRLHAYFGCRDLYIRDLNGEWKFHSQQQAITPIHVRRLIQHALNNGWQPGVPGGPHVVHNPARVALTVDAAYINLRNIASDSTELAIKDVAATFISEYMALSLCLDADLHARIMSTERNTPIPISDNTMAPLNLSFCVFRDSSDHDGCPVIALQCNEFPDIIEYYWWAFFG